MDWGGKIDKMGWLVGYRWLRKVDLEDFGMGNWVDGDILN